MTALRQLEVRRIDEDHIEIRWDMMGQRGLVLVYEGATPDEIGTDTPVAQTSSDSVVLRRPEEKGRRYYKVVPQAGSSATVAERLVPFEQIRNFRDLGGYETNDGRTVRWGRVYRSGDLSMASETDLATISCLGMRTVFDLRAPWIVSERPDRLPGSDTQLVELAMEDRGFPAMATRVLAGDISDAEEVRGYRLEGYTSAVSGLTPRMAIIGGMLLDASNLPAVFHCRAGKDRTGWVAALLLSLLGVPYDTVMEDYLLTNQYRADLVVQRTSGHPYPDTVRALMVAREEYLLAFLDSIRNLYGSFEQYALDGLGMTGSMVEQLRWTLLCA